MLERAALKNLVHFILQLIEFFLNYNYVCNEVKTSNFYYLFSSICQKFLTNLIKYYNLKHIDILILYVNKLFYS